MAVNKVDIIILRGAPASGKTQTANSLANYFKNGVRLEVDSLRQMVVSVDWKNQQEHISILQLSSGLVYDFLKLGFSPIIVVDSFSGDKINKFLDDLYHLDTSLVIKIFGLFTSETELKKRLEMRSVSEFRDYEISKILNQDVLELKADNEFQIETTGLLATKTASIIYEQLCMTND